MGDRIAFSLFFFLFLSPCAIAIGVSPSKVHIENAGRGIVVERELFVSGISQDAVLDIKTSGEAGGWLSYEAGDFRDSRRRLTVTVRIPKDAENREYGARMVISASASPEKKAQSMSVQTGVSADFLIRITGEQVRMFRVSLAMAPKTEVASDLDIILSVENTGNVFARPDYVLLSVHSPESGDAVFQHNFTDISPAPPQATSQIRLTTPHSLLPGEYRATVSVHDLGREVFAQKLLILVAAEGSLDAEGMLVKIDHARTVKPRNPLKFSALFENIGEKSITGEFVGEVYRDDTMVGLIKSMETIVEAREAEELIAYYEPLQPGAYTITGYVMFEGKRTLEKESAFTVKSASQGLGGTDITVYLAACAALVTIAALLFLRKRK